MPEDPTRSRPLLAAVAMLSLVAFLGFTVNASRGTPVKENHRVDADAVVASPLPGTSSALPAGQFVFRGAGVEEVARVELVGERTGRRSGTVIAHGDGGGASFVPDEPFESGEKVDVTTGFDIGQEAIRTYTVTMAPPPPPEPPPDPDATPPSDDDEDEDEDEPLEPQRFESRPDLEPPFLEVDVDETPDGDDPIIFSVGARAQVRSGVYVMSDGGEPVWVNHVDTSVNNAHTITLDGEPALAWWEGDAFGGWGRGDWVVVGQDYEPITRLSTVGALADFHEVVINERDGVPTAIFLLYVPQEHDLSAFGGEKRAEVLETVIQEVEIDSGAVVFEWHSLDHVPIEESTIDLTEHSVDHFHGNAIDVDADGSLLVSARSTSTVYRIDRESGHVLWRLGGKASDFTFDDGLPFEFQHDVRRLDNGTISVFDNGAERAGRKFSRAVVYDLDETTRVARVVREIRHEPDLFGEYTGLVQPTADGGMFVHWGSTSAFSEYDADDELLLDGRLPGELLYRLQRIEWHGEPTGPPDLVIEATGDSYRASMSWNGATEIRGWRVVGSADTVLADADSDGFETQLTLTAACTENPVSVVALDDDGNSLGRSGAVRLPGC